MRCKWCHAVHLLASDPDEGPTTRSVCVCETTARCVFCKHGPVVEMAVDDDLPDPHVRCRWHAENTVQVVATPLRRTGPDDCADIEEHFYYEVGRDTHRYRCGCGKTFKGSQAIVTRVRRGFALACPQCGETGYSKHEQAVRVAKRPRGR